MGDRCNPCIWIHEGPGGPGVACGSEGVVEGEMLRLHGHDAVHWRERRQGTRPQTPKGSLAW